MNESFKIDENFFLLKHPFYRAWVEGALSRESLQDYARQYYHHVVAFPDYLRNALSICKDEKAKGILAENLSEEDGTAYGTSHPELWLRFAEGAGASRDEVKTATLRKGIRNVVETFQRLSQVSYPQALGALYAYESQVPDIAQSKIEGLKRHFGISDERSLCFFEVHKSADIEHRESLLALIEALPSEQKQEAKRAADQACLVLWNFLTDVNQESACA
jgi:pyrroloquinoline-quinone synthase